MSAVYRWHAGPGGMDATDEAARGRQERLETEALTHLDALYRTALRLSRNPQDAEDLVQEAYLNAFRALDRFEEGTNLRAWLFRILNNAFISQYRRRKRRPSSSLDDVTEYYLYDHMAEGGVAPQPENPEREVLTRIGDDAVLQALEELPVEFRQVELLADVEGFSYREIADILGIPIGTVMSRLYRARRRLQKLLWEEAREAGYGASAERLRIARGWGTAGDTPPATKEATRQRGGVCRGDRARGRQDHVQLQGMRRATLHLPRSRVGRGRAARGARAPGPLPAVRRPVPFRGERPPCDRRNRAEGWLPG